MRTSLLLALVLIALAALAGCGSASAADQRDCGRIPDTNTGRLLARGDASCTLARHTYKRLGMLALANDGAYSGPVKVDGVRMECPFHETGHTVYDCRFAGGHVIVWAGKRT
jgi:hypothetical protein